MSKHKGMSAEHMAKIRQLKDTKPLITKKVINSKDIKILYNLYGKKHKALVDRISKGKIIATYRHRE